MLKKLFDGGDPSAALDKTRAKLGNVEANIAALREKRAETLLTAEDAGTVITIDKAIEVEEANAAIYKDRIKALEEECRRALFHQREGERTKAIARVRAKLTKRENLAAQLQETIEKVGALYSQLMSQDEAELDWPFHRPGYGWGQIDRHSLDREVGWLLHGLNKLQRVPLGNSIGLGVTGVSAHGIAEVCRQQSENIIARLQMVSLHDDLLDESAALPEAASR